MGYPVPTQLWNCLFNVDGEVEALLVLSSVEGPLQHLQEKKFLRPVEGVALGCGSLTMYN